MKEKILLAAKGGLLKKLRLLITYSFQPQLIKSLKIINKFRLFVICQTYYIIIFNSPVIKVSDIHAKLNFRT